MDQNLKTFLEKHKICFEVYEHPAVFTVAESKEKITKPIPGLHTKNLFLKDDKGRFYLACLAAEKRLNIKALEKRLGVKKLKFSSPEDLKKELNLTPGSVSLFGLVYAKNVKLILDDTVWKSPSVGFHPNVNTATVVISHEGLVKFLAALNIQKEIFNLE
jgi:Ala-tRNA(Pro) deacylase